MAKIADLTDMSLNMLSEGMFGRVIESEMMRLTHDLEQRGGDCKPRKLVIQLDVKYDQGLKRYVISPTCQAKLPPQQAYATQAKMEFDPAKKGYVLQFNPESIVTDQGTIDEAIGK